MHNEINIEEIMSEIRENIKERGYDKEPLSFEEVAVTKPVLQGDSEYDAEEFNREIEYLNYNWSNTYQVPITGGNPIGVFIKKVIRKLTRFIVFPIVNFQNAYNASNVRCLKQIKEYMAEMEEYKVRIAELEKEIEELKGKQ